MKAVQISTIERRMKALDKMLEGRQYIMGDAFSVADPYLFNMMLGEVQHNIDIAQCPNVAAINARVGQRKYVQAAMQVEGLIK